MMGMWPLPGPDAEKLDIDEVSKWAGHKSRAIRKMIREGIFPRPRFRAGNKDFWHASDLAAWMHLQDRMRSGEILEENDDDDD